MLPSFSTVDAQILGRLDFRKESVCISLTKAIFQHEFGLRWSIPPGHLCPAIPSRLEYLCWIETLLKFEGDLQLPIRGLDIGTGASCVYPLLGAKLLGFYFTATEVDQESYQSALKNIQDNNLDSQVEIRKASQGEILHGVMRGTDTFHFVMCNPPFFADMSESSSHPFRVKTGDGRQMVTSGGEVSFISQMARESVEWSQNIRWFTSLVGRKKDLGILQRYIQQNITTEVRRTCLKQGRTSRWIIAWSFKSHGALVTE
ncbi:Methyltransferase-like protein 16 [Galdieria sulphuraria]|nr:Methyltransferase-like protein 16 [Galdieria sulphuraria]